MTFARVSTFLAAASVAFATAACDSTPAESEDDHVAEGDVTYQAGIKAVIDQKCANCHNAGGIGPFSLETYADVASHINAVRSAIDSGSMPPWPVKDDCNDYKNDRSLDPADKEKLLAWIDAGAPEGSTPETAEGESAAGLSRVDRTLGMPVDYTPAMAPDDYRCFLLDWQEAETTFVTGFRANPGNASTVHHVIAYVIPPSQVAKYQKLDADEEGAGYTCFGGPGGGIDQETRFVGSWAPGTAGGDLPEGTGIRIEPGSKIALQVHYNTSHGAGSDRTSIDLKLDPTVEHEGVWQFFTNIEWLFGAGMEIPPMTSDVKHEYSMDPTGFVAGGKPFVIHSVGLHMHTLGQSIRLSVEQPSADAEACLLDIPQWDFHWQGSYDLKEPIVFQPGQKLKIECTWDNPTANTVRWGEGTGDEMCLGLIYYTVP